MPEISERRQKVERKRLRRNRWEFLANLSAALEFPMAALGLLWLILVVYNLVTPNAPPLVAGALKTIWYVFVADFALRLLIAPDKAAFLRANWAAALAMLLPALGMLRIFTALTSVQMVMAMANGNSIALLILSSVNRSMNALRKLLRRRGTVYVVTLTLIVWLAGAAGMLATEKNVPAANGIHSFTSSLYWSFMMLTTIGSEYWPKTPQGKLICMALSMYAVGILGYISGTLASFFIGRDAHDEEGDIAGERELQKLRKELQELRAEMRSYFHNKTE